MIIFARQGKAAIGQNLAFFTFAATNERMAHMEISKFGWIQLPSQ